MNKLIRKIILSVLCVMLVMFSFSACEVPPDVSSNNGEQVIDSSALGYEIPVALRCKDAFYIFNSRRDKAIMDERYTLVEIGMVEDAVEADQYPTGNNQVNCEELRQCPIFTTDWCVENDFFDELYVLYEGEYWRFSLPNSMHPCIRYDGELYFSMERYWGSDENFKKVGTVVKSVPVWTTPTADYYSNFGAEGCELYICDDTPEKLYLLSNETYFIYVIWEGD